MLQQTLIKDSSTGKNIEFLDFLYETQLDAIFQHEHFVGDEVVTTEYQVVDIEYDVIKSHTIPKRVLRVISAFKVR